MKKNDVFIARLARGAVASTLTVCLMPQTHTGTAAAQPEADGAAFTDLVSMPELGTQEGTDKAVVLTLGQMPGEWDKHMEREFRKLALGEARGQLTDDQARRLEQLNNWRNRLLCPQPSGEILLQIKRDRLLARMEELLKDYVEFEEAAGKARATA